MAKIERKGFNEKNDNGNYLDETYLGIVMSKLYSEEYIFFHNKSVEGSNISNRPDYHCSELKLIFEFDGYRHFTLPETIKIDEMKDKVYKQLGYKVIRIPYFLQLDNKALEFFGMPSGKDYSRGYSHGFIDKKALLPAAFCSLGINKFYKLLDELPEPIERDINKSLDNKIKDLGDKQLVYPVRINYR